MKTIFFVALAVCAAMVAAECPNACSGHGTCGPKDMCTCYPNWEANDCSQRTCPFGLAFVDTPQGDLNHDGDVSDASGGVAVQWNNVNTWEKFPNVASTQYIAIENEAHFYVECSNKGTCDRESGECVCYEGYEGSSCQRTTCPDDCSGHGVCRTTAEIAAGRLNRKLEERVGHYAVWSGVESTFTYNLWDSDKNQACVCDFGWSGYNCAERECPRGDDPMTHRSTDCAGYACADERQVLSIALDSAAHKAIFEFTFMEWTGQTWVTNQVTIGSTGANTHGSTDAAAGAAVTTAIANLLTDLPNGAIERVSSQGALASNTYTITFDFFDNAGDIAGLGCNVVSELTSETATCSFTQTRQGNKEEVTCSNRGLCDYATGICKCFKGYFDDDCSVQHALAL